MMIKAEIIRKLIDLLTSILTNQFLQCEDLPLVSQLSLSFGLLV